VRVTAAGRWLLAVLVAEAVVLWALVELIGPEYAWVGVVGSLGAPAMTWWQTFRTPAMRRGQDVPARALADHRDPGPELRASVDDRAWALLAAPRSNEWMQAAVCSTLAVACVAVALHRSVLSVAVPAAPLVVLAVVAPVLTRRRLLAASRWLDDPPFAREQA